MKVLLIQFSGLHLGYIGCYGNDWVNTPTLDRLAAEGIVFDQHYADCPGQWDTASTGLYRFAWRARRSLPPTPTLSDLLTANGIPAVRITAAQLGAAQHVNPASYHDEIRQALRNAIDSIGGSEHWLITLELPSLLPPWLVGEDFLAHYFLPDVETPETEGPVDDVEEETDEPVAEESVAGAPDIEDSAADSDEWSGDYYDDDTATSESYLPMEPDTIDDAGGEASEQEVALMPLLDPPLGAVDSNEDTLIQRLQLSYAAAVSQADAYLRTALEQLRESGVLEETLLIITADHGLHLGEHGTIGDTLPYLHEELVHLPLLICLPGAAQAGRRIAALTQPVDLFPTILEAMRIAPPECHGHSLFPLMSGNTSNNRDYVCTGVKLDDLLEWALRTPQWAVLLPEEGNAKRPPQLYAKPEDRWEMNNLRQPNLDLAERLEETLRNWIQAVGQTDGFRPPALSMPEESR